jgi:hypothetical protein
MKNHLRKASILPLPPLFLCHVPLQLSTSRRVGMSRGLGSTLYLALAPYADDTLSDVAVCGGKRCGARALLEESLQFVGERFERFCMHR